MLHVLFQIVFFSKLKSIQDWSVNSPDLNIIENILGKLKNALGEELKGKLTTQNKRVLVYLGGKIAKRKRSQNTSYINFYCQNK